MDINNNELRSQILYQKGIVLWLTGLSGAGKTAIAYNLESKLLIQKKFVYVLDGDNIRKGLNSDLGFSLNDRNENIRRITEVAALFQDLGIITIVAFISPCREMREFARKRLGDGFYEIYINASIETCIKRDPKRLYKKAINNEIPNFTGITSVYEEPLKPELVIDTDVLTIEEANDLIFNLVK